MPPDRQLMSYLECPAYPEKLFFAPLGVLFHVKELVQT